MRQNLYVLAFLFTLVSCTKSDQTTPVPTLTSPATLSRQSANEDHEQAIAHLFSQPLYVHVYCGQTEVDVLSGIVTDQHCVMFGHFNPDYPGDLNMFIWQWMNHRFYGEMTSMTTGEVFKMEMTRRVVPDAVAFNVLFHENLIGDRGTHYVLSGSFLRYAPYTITIDKALCLGNGPSK